jgi:hypothetical protein
MARTSLATLLAGLALLPACFDRGSTLGDACTQTVDCYGDQVCSSQGVCVPSGDGDSGTSVADTGDGDGDATADATGDTGDTTTGDGDGDTGIEPDACGMSTYACGNGVDDDNDMLIDGQDPDCTGPCDDDEAQLGSSLPGVMACATDCFWDDNSGNADDMCTYDPACDPLNPGEDLGCAYDMGANCPDPNPECITNCVPLTPKGCDCFGCCDLGDGYVSLRNDQCTPDNPAQCASCTPVMDCFSPCDDSCDLCIGMAHADLPAECMGVPSCDTSPCDFGGEGCPMLSCVSGCCVMVPFFP